MADRNGIKWNREETILAYELYCRTPFSRISQNNPEIRKLAELMDTMTRRKIDIMCLQETKWIGDKAREISH